MEIEVELLRINRTSRPNGEFGFVLEFGESFVPIQVNDRPKEAKIILSVPGQGQVNMPYENRLVLFFSETEFRQIAEKFVVGKSYKIQADKKGIKVNFGGD